MAVGLAKRKLKYIILETTELFKCHKSPFETLAFATVELDQQEVDTFGAVKSLSHRWSYPHVSKDQAKTLC